VESPDCPSLCASDLPSLIIFLSRGSQVDPQVRASNEHILIVRVPRAGGRPGRPLSSYTGRGAKPVGLVSARTRSLMLLPNLLVAHLFSPSTHQGIPSRVARLTGGPRYPPRLSREGKLELTNAHGRKTVAAGIPEGFRPVQPGRIGPGGRCATRDGIPLLR
jgi:hypothetical protein